MSVPTFLRWPGWWLLYDSFSSSPLWTDRIFHGTRDQNSPLARPVNEKLSIIKGNELRLMVKDDCLTFLDRYSSETYTVLRRSHFVLICSAFASNSTTSVLWFLVQLSLVFSSFQLTFSWWVGNFSTYINQTEIEYFSTMHSLLK